MRSKHSTPIHKQWSRHWPDYRPQVCLISHGRRRKGYMFLLATLHTATHLLETAIVMDVTYLHTSHTIVPCVPHARVMHAHAYLPPSFMHISVYYHIHIIIVQSSLPIWFSLLSGPFRILRYFPRLGYFWFHHEAL